MFTRISNTLAGVVAKIGNRPVKYQDSDAYLFKDNPAALAYLARRRELGSGTSGGFSPATVH
jgi:hypothetical protein